MAKLFQKTENQEPYYLSVSEVARLINDILKQGFPQLLFRGEISQVTFHQNGHLYFTVKDAQSQMSCVIWSSTLRRLSFKPKVGMSVRCHGDPGVYPARGSLQITVTRIVEEGQGELHRRFEELSKRLEVEGFFAPERKREIPFLPKAVGIVTSSTGAVIHDMMVKINERFPSMVVYLADTRVQGDGAAAEIAAAIKRLDRSGLVDVIIVARGGGSLEDLWAFNEEDVVKAVFSCVTPVVSGVGHEVDFTLCDKAADLRAATPTAAAERVVPRRADLLLAIEELERRLAEVEYWVQMRVQKLDELCARFETRLVALKREASLKLKLAEGALIRIKPDRVIERLSLKFKPLEDRLFAALERTRIERLRRVNELATRLEVASPTAVLARGYSIVSYKGRALSSVLGVEVNDVLDIKVRDGVITSVVKDKRLEGV